MYRRTCFFSHSSGGQSLESRCQQGHATSESSSSCLSQLLGTQVFLGLWLHHTPLCLCVHTTSFPVWLETSSASVVYEPLLLAVAPTRIIQNIPSRDS